MKEPLITISLSDFNDLKAIEALHKDEHDIIYISTWDGYNEGKIYYSQVDIFKKIRETVGSVLDDYYGKYTLAVNKLKLEEPKKTWIAKLLKL